MPKPATLHLLCGKIASGKSTLAAQLSRTSDTVLLIEDHLLASLYPGEIKTLPDYARCAARLREAMGPVVIDLLRAGMSVVLDFQANTPAARAWMRGLFEGADAHHRLHYLCPSDDTCKVRLRARNVKGTHPYQVSDVEFDMFSSYFVPPAESENFEVVTYGGSEPLA
jgi:predicted kinase